MTTSTRSESAAKKDVTKLQRAIVDGLEDVKAQDIQVFNTEKLSPLFERVIVASGTSNRQTKALAASVRDAVREAGFPKPRTEGEDNGEWIIVDCGAAVAHIMQPAIRQYYRLEEIWGETPVRLKLGAAKPVKAAESGDAAPAKKKAAPRKKAAAAEAEVPARKPGRGKATAAAPAPAPARKAAGKAAPAKAAAAKAPAKAPARAPAKAAAGKSPAAKSAAPKVKTVVVKPVARKPAAKSAAAKAPAAPRKAAARKAPSRKKAG
ncbi:ribosome silencing factor [Paracidovorax citrulli]|uniref:Ribosomal silencing factor RsfS n=2 Tax=Paracidovorax citrulli TaxID=80869 RepID=A1TS24_PARC0|nr:ribosome silencing factor [Paracidovorax citrulli]ABM33762.1 iojap-like protein [Paracidovorax citrulli AAC00-1]ATG94350.1 ribosome silencing factor [Paracidovorax citrulli]PVY63198.1 ribosome-associated protein [Paracidovorax citrulli]REG67827.1 ribosome-associated protein [Paracidovorax citrulli]RLJ92386.1 ribosome-associated protein [Paracidovorax citrulli]